MNIDRIHLTPDYSISRIIKGGWHLAGGHGQIDKKAALNDMRAFVEAGITTFDCADIYTGVEALIGQFNKKYKKQFTRGDLPQVQVHTKYVPDYSALSTTNFEDTSKIIDRSLQRLGVDRLDLVQFHWWDYNVPRYVEVAHHLKNLQQAGKIRYIGVTNFDGPHLQEIIDSGVSLLTNQVQYSLLDQRVEKDMNAIMEKHNIWYLCYGVVAGGFLSDRFLKISDPSKPMENRSLTKYRLIIDEFGGWDYFQKALKAIKLIADKYQVGIAEIVTRYILQKDYVASAIIGARNSNHLQKYQQLNNFSLDKSDLNLILSIVENSQGPNGPFYALERDKSGKHGAIMKYNLNKD
jgi:aryl-alcohol dehydrogenase-like predicted oxidoreductase